MRSKKAVDFLKDVIAYVYGEGQKARTQDEHEDVTITLRILKSILEGWTQPVLAGYMYAVGVHPDRLRRLRLERHAHLAWELSAKFSVSPAKAERNNAKVYQMPTKRAAAKPIKKRAGGER
jgi:hypothetical protein